MYHIGVDLGGTSIKAGIVSADWKILLTDSVPTDLPRSAGEIAESIYRLVLQLLETGCIAWDETDSIGVGIPGTVNQKTGIVEYANNFDFKNTAFLELLRGKFEKPVFMENDAQSAAWGEHIAGAGRGHHSMLAVTLGTGVGGGIILDDKLWHGMNYAAGEVGHMVIRMHGRDCTCGRKGCFEAYASVTALCRMAAEAAEKYPESVLMKLKQSEEGLNGRNIISAVRNHDKAAEEAYEQYTDYLALGLVNLINIFQPEILVIGGGLSGAGEFFLHSVVRKVKPAVYSRYSEDNTEIRLAALGNDAGIIGAAALGMLHPSAAE